MSDGYECVTNATFNGVNSSVSYSPVNITDDGSAGTDRTIEVTFRTNKAKGTLFHFVGADPDQYIRLKVGQNHQLVVDLPVRNSTATGSFGSASTVRLGSTYM